MRTYASYSLKISSYFFAAVEHSVALSRANVSATDYEETQFDVFNHIQTACTCDGWAISRLVKIILLLCLRGNTSLKLVMWCDLNSRAGSLGLTCPHEFDRLTTEQRRYYWNGAVLQEIVAMKPFCTISVLDLFNSCIGVISVYPPAKSQAHPAVYLLRYIVVFYAIAIFVISIMKHKYEVRQ